MPRFTSMFILALVAIGVHSTHAATINLGTGEIGSSDGTASFLTYTGLSIANSNIVGGDLPAEVTFTLKIQGFDDFDINTFGGTTGNVKSQTGGIGVVGGKNDSGLDNLDSPAREALFFSISDVTGLAPGRTLLISGFSIAFGGSSDFYRLAQLTTSGLLTTPVTQYSTPDVATLPNANLMVVVWDNPDSVEVPGTGTNDSRYGIGALEVIVTPAPAALPTGLAMLGLAAARRSPRR